MLGLIDDCASPSLDAPFMPADVCLPHHQTSVDASVGFKHHCPHPQSTWLETWHFSDLTCLYDVL